MQDAYGILGCYEEGMEAKGKRTTLRQQGVLECAIITMNMVNWTPIIGMLKGVHRNRIIGSIIVSQSLRKTLKNCLNWKSLHFVAIGGILLDSNNKRLIRKRGYHHLIGPRRG